MALRPEEIDAAADEEAPEIEAAIARLQAEEDEADAEATSPMPAEELRGPTPAPWFAAWTPGRAGAPEWTDQDDATEPAPGPVEPPAPTAIEPPAPSNAPAARSDQAPAPDDEASASPLEHMGAPGFQAGGIDELPPPIWVSEQASPSAPSDEVLAAVEKMRRQLDRVPAPTTSGRRLWRRSQPAAASDAAETVPAGRPAEDFAAGSDVAVAGGGRRLPAVTPALATAAAALRRWLDVAADNSRGAWTTLQRQSRAALPQGLFAALPRRLPISRPSREDEFEGGTEGRRRTRVPVIAIPAAIGGLLALGLIAVGLFVLLPHHPKSTSVSHRSAAASHASVATAPQPAPSHASAPTPAATGAPSLQQVSTAGQGGSGYQVLGMRAALHTDGVYRLVFDLQGAGPRPTVTLGRAADGSYYLVAPGITIDPAVLARWAPGGPVSSVAQQGSSGLQLRLGMTRPVSYSLIYLSAPTRLVIDFGS